MSRSGSEQQDVIAGGRRIRLSNLDKVLYPETGTTKRDVIDYYARVADVLIPHTSDRPLTRKRWVQGVGTPAAPGEMFFQKNLDERSTPTWVARHTIQHSERVSTYPLLNDLATLTWLGQIASLEMHVPQWRFDRAGLAQNPDRLVLDLDPGPGATLMECAEVARWARVILNDMGLDPVPVTSGSKGIHLYAALDGTQSASEVSEFAHELARALEADHPELVVSDMKRSLRTGKVLVDWSQNSGSKTTVSPYSLRGRTNPTVAAPRTWRELASSGLEHLDYRDVIRRVADGKDPLRSVLGRSDPGRSDSGRSDSPGPPAADPGIADDRLQRYRSMRDRARTPEPVPTASPVPTGERSFVIQEHHARRLHWDFRLEHQGVLVSWAIPKGVPTDAGRNHLAVQTEDHPLEYGSFAGTIPAGEYGAGEVTIWDSGTYDLEKWRDGSEVIVTVHGRNHGSRRYALIHTGGKGDPESNNWLIHLMKEPPHPPPPRPNLDQADAPRPDWSDTAPPSPMLATPGSARDFLGKRTGWSFEMKWDGIRAIAEVRGERIRVSSRNGIDVTARYPELSLLAESLRGDAVLDGEIVAMNEAGRPDFGTLQKRMGLTGLAEIERERKRTPVYFMTFDVLSLGGSDIASRPYSERRGLLESAVKPNGTVLVPPVFDGDLDAALLSSRELGFEGVVGKANDSLYVQGQRSRSWIKVKHQRTQEAVIGGWRPGQGNRANRIGALLLGIPQVTGNTDESGRLQYVGRVGTGFTERQLDTLLATLSGMQANEAPFVGLTDTDARGARFVVPSVVCEVSFAGWTPGGKLRHPSWRGLRMDLHAAGVAKEP